MYLIGLYHFYLLIFNLILRFHRPAVIILSVFFLLILFLKVGLGWVMKFFWNCRDWQNTWCNKHRGITEALCIVASRLQPCPQPFPTFAEADFQACNCITDTKNSYSKDSDLSVRKRRPDFVYVLSVFKETLQPKNYDWANTLNQCKFFPTRITIT